MSFYWSIRVALNFREPLWSACRNSFPRRLTASLMSNPFTHPYLDIELLAVFMEDGNFDYKRLSELSGIEKLRMLKPIMPIATRKGVKPPLFTSVQEMVALAEKEHVDCSEIAIRYEMGRTLETREQLIARMAHVWEVIRGTVDKGESCLVQHMRGPGHPLSLLALCRNVWPRGENITDEVTSRALAIAIYAHEGKNDKNTLSVAGPAAGCPPIMAGSLLPLAEARGLTDNDIIYALFTAAAIGAVTYMKTVPNR